MRHIQNDISQKQNMAIETADKKDGITFLDTANVGKKKDMKLVIAIVSRGFSSEVVEASREAGAEGAVIVEGRALGQTEKKFFGLRIEPETEMLFIAVPERISLKVSKNIYKKFSFGSEARCMVLVLPLASYFI